jgi:hypothetical protein
MLLIVKSLAYSAARELTHCWCFCFICSEHTRTNNRQASNSRTNYRSALDFCTNNGQASNSRTNYRSALDFCTNNGQASNSSTHYCSALDISTNYR